MFYKKMQSKIMDRSEAVGTVTGWRAAGERIVFTNGCFDLLHPGHVHYLAQARDLGDRLIVGLNADVSVRRLKGPHRPIQDEHARAIVLASLACVDAVTIFEEDTPLDLIKKLLPDVLVKGGDWEPSRIVGAAEVLANGGEVHSLPFLEGYATTLIEERVRTLRKVGTRGKSE